MLQFPSFNLTAEHPEKEVVGASEARHQAFGYCCRDDQGRIYATWRDGASHGVVGAGRLRMRRYDQDGAFDLGVTVLAEPEPGRDLRDPMICWTPEGKLVLVWDDTPSVGVGVTHFKSKTSGDRGANWGPEKIIQTVPFNYARVYGGLKVLPSTDPCSPWELGFTSYYQTGIGAYAVDFSISRDGGETFLQASSIGQALIGNAGAGFHNETAFDGVNSLLWFAAARESDCIQLKWSVNGRQSWGAWQTVPWTVPAAHGVHVAPSIDVVKDEFGRPWLLLGVTDRTNDWVEWSAALVSDVLNRGVAAFPSPIRGHSCSNAYPATIIYPDGNLAFTFTREYTGTTYASTHLGYFNYRSMLSQRGPLKIKKSTGPVAIANGKINYTSRFMNLTTEGGAATDNLVTILGGEEDDVLIICSTSSSKDIVVKHDMGNIQLTSGQDIILNNSMKRLALHNHGPFWTDLFTW